MPPTENQSSLVAAALFLVVVWYLQQRGQGMAPPAGTAALGMVGTAAPVTLYGGPPGGPVPGIPVVITGAC